MSLTSVTTFPAAIRIFLLSPGPAIAASALCLSLAGLYYISADGGVYVLLAIALLCRSLGEWFAHKYVLHVMKIRVLGICIRNPIAEMHAKHHATPDDPEGVHFGATSVIGVLVLGYAIGALWGTAFSLGVVVFFSASLLLYEWAHLVSHTGYTPRSRYFRKITARHRYHHYKDPKRCFTVSQPWADVVLRTDAPPQYLSSK